MMAMFNNYYAYTNLTPTDIYPIQYGEQECRPSYSFGPCARSNFLIHYVYEGKGILQTEKGVFNVGKGQMFLIFPYQSAYYKADADEPWLYRWIEFNGSMAEHIAAGASIDENNPVFTDTDNQLGESLEVLVKGGEMSFGLLMQKFWAVLSALKAFEADAYDKSPVHIKKAENYIKINMHKKITVTDIAEYIGIDRSYLSRLFAKYCQKSPQEYILSLKMNTALRYLADTNMSVSEVAQSVGYSDIRIFYKVFKKRFNCSPSQWRTKQKNDKYIISW